MVDKFGWNDANFKQAREMKLAGASATEIAEALNADLPRRACRATRNAVIGKMARAGLAKGKRTGGGRPRVAREETAPRTQRPISLSGQTAARAKAATVDSLDLKFAMLTETTCRYPHGDPQTPEFSYCGQPKKRGQMPYCTFHAQLCGAGYSTPKNSPIPRFAR